MTSKNNKIALTLFYYYVIIIFRFLRLKMPIKQRGLIMRDLKSYEPFFGEWYIERPIYENEIGGIYEIRKRDSDEPSKALKVIRMPDPGLDPEGNYAEKLQVDYVAEIEMMQALKDHINVTAYEEYEVLSRGDEPGWDIVIRMEMVTPVPEYIRSNPFTIGDAVLLGCDVCSMLEFCHPHEIVHRNICPQNIFVSTDGVFKVGDFAIEDPNGNLLSTLTDIDANCYMAPEVYYGEEPVPSSDIYSLGLLLYGLLNNNRLPFMPPYPQQLALSDTVLANEKRFHGEPLPPPENAGEALSAIILKACSPEIEDRYASAAEMKAALNEVLYQQAADPVAEAQSDEVIVGAMAEQSAEAENVYEPETDYEKKTTGESAIAVDSVKEVKKKRDRLTTILTVIAVLAVVVLSAFGVKYFLNDEPVIGQPDPSDVSDVSDTEPSELPSEEPTKAEENIPSLVGMNADDAEILLKDLGFRVLKRNVSSDTMAEGFVAGQSPVANTEAPRGSVVTITISLGKQEGTVTGVTLDKSVATVAVGQKITLTARITPIDARNPAVAWSTSVPGIATVTSDGVVSGVAEGTCIITATTVDGNKTASCTVAVVAATDVTVPNQVGQNQTIAKEALTSLGLNVTMTEQYNSTVAVGKVISQSLVAGSTAKTGDTINLVISLGPDPNATTSPTPTNPTNPGTTTVAVSGITVSPTSVSLSVGVTRTVAATITPSNATNKTINWTSSNTSVATVSTSGLVTAKGVGSATIIATTADGGKTAYCTVSVVASSVAVTSVTMSRTTASLNVGETVTLSATVAPSDATDKNITWSSSNTSVATVSGGTVTAKAVGSATITATAGGKTATCTVTVTDKNATVVSVVGKSEAAAKTALENAGFKVSISYDYSGTGTNGNVMAQVPSAGSVAEKGSTVYLTVSRVYVSITVLCDEGGTVTGSDMYVPGTTATITATPERGYRFVKWSDGNTQATRTITVGNTSAVYTAVFEKITES